MNPDQAIAAFASTVLQPAGLPDAFEVVARACNARMVTMVNTARRGELSCSRSERGLIDAYLHERQVPDTRRDRVKPGLDEGFRVDLDDYTPEELARDPYYNEFLGPADVRWHAAASLPGWNERLVISFKRSPRQGPFERDDVAMLNRMLPWLRIATRHAALIAQSRFDGELAAFARANRGAICLDDSGRVDAVNDLVRFGDGLCLEGGRLSASRAVDRAALARAIATAASGPALGAPAPLPVIVCRPGGRRPLVVDVIAVPAPDLVDLRRCRLLLVVTDPERQVPPRRSVLLDAFGLTPREAELAECQARGLTVRAAAAELRISEGHARQRMKAVLGKTGTTRQAELVALLHRLG